MTHNTLQLCSVGTRNVHGLRTFVAFMNLKLNFLTILEISESLSLNRSLMNKYCNMLCEVSWTNSWLLYEKKNDDRLLSLSAPPSSIINPNPLAMLNHFTVPVAIPCCCCIHNPDRRAGVRRRVLIDCILVEKWVRVFPIRPEPRARSETLKLCSRNDFCYLQSLVF